MDVEKGASDLQDFHDSELGDVYDLYNACNGVMRGGLLDDGKLDELSRGELEVFDVKRLKEVWFHVAGGCGECEHIIGTLNAARGPVRTDAGEPAPERFSGDLQEDLVDTR